MSEKWAVGAMIRNPFMSLIDSPLFVKFSKMANFNFRESWFGFFFNFLRFVTRNTPPSPFLKFSSMEKVFKIDLNLQTFFFFNFHLYFLGDNRLSCLPLNCHYHQILTSPLNRLCLSHINNNNILYLKRVYSISFH